MESIKTKFGHNRFGKWKNEVLVHFIDYIMLHMCIKDKIKVKPNQDGICDQ